MVKLDLIDFRIATSHPSAWGTIEFRLVLEKVSVPLSAESRRARQLAAVPSMVDTVPEPSVPASPLRQPVASPFRVTAREEALVRRKRQIIEAPRGLVPSRRRP